jgi:F420-non-reducing hydrogenase small subunit
VVWGRAQSERVVSGKPRIGMYCASGCGGCDLSLLEIHEHLLDLIAATEIVFWPAAIDFKYSDVEAMPDGCIDICFVNGGMRTSENAHIADLLRAKSRVLIAYGACSSFGGVPGLANLYPARDVVDRAFATQSTDAVSRRPSASAKHANGEAVGLPAVLGTVRALSDAVPVEYVIPGCPPSAKQVWAVCRAALAGELPAAPAVLGAGTKAVCDECSLEKHGDRVKRFVRSHEVVPEPGRCLLEQGIVCTGPATRSGCGAQCTSALMPCRGCYGPAGDAIDTGAAMAAALGTIVDSEDEAVIRETVRGIADPLGTFYTYTLATSLLGHARSADADEEVAE